MSRYYDYLKEKELKVIKQLSYEEIAKARETMDDEAFNKRYQDGLDYSDVMYKDVPQEDINTYLIYEMLKEQRETRKGIQVIKGILIFYLVLTLLGILSWLIVLCVGASAM